MNWFQLVLKSVLDEILKLSRMLYYSPGLTTSVMPTAHPIKHLELPTGCSVGALVTKHWAAAGKREEEKVMPWLLNALHAQC